MKVSNQIPAKRRREIERALDAHDPARPEWDRMSGAKQHRFFGKRIKPGSNRQLNDWYKGKKNKRAKSLQGKLVGKSGLKPFIKGYKEFFKMRWKIEPGDAILIACTSGKPAEQFHAFWRWISRHSDIWVDYETKSYSCVRR